MKKHLQLLVIIIAALFNAERANAQVKSTYGIGKSPFLNLPSMGITESLNTDIDSTDVRNGETSYQTNFGTNAIIAPPTNVRVDNVNVCNDDYINMTATCESDFLPVWSSSYNPWLGVGSPFKYYPPTTQTYFVRCVNFGPGLGYSESVTTEAVRVSSTKTFLSENFESAELPIGWLVRDVDNNLTNMSGLQSTWSLNDLIKGVVLTSSKTGFISDDWLWTPLVSNITNNTKMTWSRTGPIDFEIRVMKAADGPPTGGPGVIGNQLTHSTKVSLTTTYYGLDEVSLAEFAGQSIYIAFRNRGRVDDVLRIDNIIIKSVRTTPLLPPTGTMANVNKICGSGSVTLTSNCSDGILTWYNQAIGGVAIGTGSPFLHAPNQTTTYYASCVSECESRRVATNEVKVYSIPTAPIITPPISSLEVCFPSTLTFTASGCEGTVTWSQGAVTGTTLTLTEVGGYGVSATCSNSCFTSNESEYYSAYINSVPNAPTNVIVNNTNICNGSTVSLTANCEFGFQGQINWYTQASGGVSIGSGNTFTHIPSSTVTYYAACADYCESARVATLAVTVTNSQAEMPTSVAVNTNDVCSNGTVSLTANCLYGTVNWYNQAIGGIVLGTGSPFLHALTSETTYYASCLNGCESNRVATNRVIPPYIPLFTESFDGIDKNGFPNGWFLRNVDNLMPFGLISDYNINDAWVRTAYGSDSVVVSTSFYDPAGQADDWMWTPLIQGITANTKLKWKAIANNEYFYDGYEVRIMTGTNGPPTGGTGEMGNQLTNSTRVLSIYQESPYWTSREVSLTDYAGQSVYVGFRNNSNDKHTLLINDVIVEAPIVPPTGITTNVSEVCQNGTVTLTANCPVGTINWYSQATGGVALGTGSPFTHSPTFTTTYYASCAGGCESSRVATNQVTVILISAPTITLPASLSVCSPATLTAHGCAGTVTWSQGGTTGTSLTLSAVGTYSISATCTVNGCTSEPSAAVSGLEIKTKPNAPTIVLPASLSVCSPATLTLNASGCEGTVTWSQGAATGTSLTLSAIGTYSITAICTVNGCSSAPSAVVTGLEIKAKPNAPTITPPTIRSVCSPNVLEFAVRNCVGQLNWSGGAQESVGFCFLGQCFFTSTISTIGTYNVTATCTVNACTSEPSVTVTGLEIKASPTPTIIPPASLSVCSPATLTLTASGCAGKVTWSQGAASGTSLTLSDVGTYSISAKCTVNGCTSAPSAAVTGLEIKAIPNAPTITPPASLSVCSPTTLTASGCAGTVIWSQVTSMGTILTPTTVGTYSISATGNYNITATCTVNGCTSAPSAAVTGLEIKAIPNAPTITPPASLSVCSPATLTLTASGCAGTVTWSQVAATGTSLTLSSAGTYSITATCTVNGCTSAPSAAVTGLEIKAIPNAPTITPPASLSVCSPATLTLTASGCAGTVTWSQVAATGTSLTLSSAGTYSITATCTVNGCTSAPSAAVTGFEIKAKPNSPTITPPASLSVCSPATLTLTASGCTGTVTWSQGAAAGTSLTLSSAGTYSITATCTVNGCTSAPSAAITGLEIKAKPNIAASNTGPYTVGQTINLNGSGGGTYSWTGPNYFSSSLSNPIISNALSINAGTYTLSVVGTNSCQDTATTNVVIGSIDPCNISQIVDYLYVKAGNPYQPLFQLTNGMIINQVTEKVSILINPVCPSVTIESFEISIQGPELNWNILQNAAPYGLFDNFGLEGKYFNPGSYTLTVTGYAQDNKGGGITYGPKIITFVVVGYLATINTPSLSKTTICAGNSVDIAFVATGSFNNTNQFYVELSDASGSFERPILIGTTNSIGTINCTIPPNTVEGANYRIRVISSNQVVVSNPAVSPITVYPLTHSLISPNNNLTGINIKKAVNTINARNKITSPANVTYQAGKTIVLTPGFESNAVFKAEIKACNN